MTTPILIRRLLDPTCRELWFDSLAYMTFAEHVKPRTHIFKVMELRDDYQDSR